MSSERNEQDIQSAHQCDSLAVEAASQKWPVVSINPQSSSCDNSCNLSRASCSARRVLRLNSGPWAIQPLQVRHSPVSIQTKVWCLSMVWPLCRRTTPLTTSCWPLMCLRTRIFFHSPLFFSSPTINGTSPTSGWFRAPLLIWWLSMRPWTYSLFHRCHTCCFFSLNRAINLVVSAPSNSRSSTVCTSWP